MIIGRSCESSEELPVSSARVRPWSASLSLSDADAAALPDAAAAVCSLLSVCLVCLCVCCVKCVCCCWVCHPLLAQYYLLVPLLCRRRLTGSWRQGHQRPWSRARTSAAPLPLAPFSALHRKHRPQARHPTACPPRRTGKHAKLACMHTIIHALKLQTCQPHILEAVLLNLSLASLALHFFPPLQLCLGLLVALVLIFRLLLFLIAA